MEARIASQKPSGRLRAPGSVARAARGLGLAWLALCGAALGCRSSEPPLELVRPAPTPTPPADQAGRPELPDAETAFGLPVPEGLRVARHFADSAYLSGRLSMNEALAEIRKHVISGGVELTAKRALFSRAYIRQDEQKRLFRIEISKTHSGSQVRINDITPPPTTHGLSESERWRRAGRNPDGTLIDPNNVF